MDSETCTGDVDSGVACGNSNSALRSLALRPHRPPLPFHPRWHPLSPHRLVHQHRLLRGQRRLRSCPLPQLVSHVRGHVYTMSLTTSWLANNLRGRASLAMGTAIILGIGNCANFVSSNVFVKKEAPLYPTAFRTGLGITAAGAAGCLVYVGLLWRHNRRLDEKRSEDSGVDVADDHQVYRFQY
jgi:hypothetical protein